jgi:antitoxin component YwqK of YwqJK toxin-antitoxin module
MTIPALALLFNLVTISESRAEYCEPRISSGCWSGGSYHINSGLCYYYKCYSDETKLKSISYDSRLFLLESKDYQFSTAPDGTITIVNKNDTTEVYTIDTAPVNSSSSYAYDDNGKQYKTHYEYTDASGYGYNRSYAYDDNWKQYTTHDEWTYADGSGYSYDYGYDDSWHQTSQNYVSKDKDGNITNDYGYTWDYDENGRRTDENYVRKDGNGNITETRDSEWTYNDDGNQTEYSYDRKDGDGNMLDYGTEQYEYNADGNQISHNYNAYYGNGQLMDSEQNTYVYDDDGNEIHNEYVNKEYYENGQISYDEYEEWDEVTGSKDFEKEYYENGQLSYEYESYDYPDGTYHRESKDYYENGQLSQTNVWGTDENGIYTDNYVYYDENGNITSEENYTRNPDGTWTQDNMYYEYDDDGKLISKTNEICNNDGCSSVSYDANGDLLSVNDNEVTENCASADSNGVCTKCKDGFDDIDGYCNKIRWTPAEAAKVLRDDNTNSVTITFKK